MNKSTLALLSVVALGHVLLTGCVSQRDTMISQGYPQAYAEGFDDGCHSGNNAGGSLFEQFKKDVRRFETDKEYAQGWSDAYKQCESQQLAIQRQTQLSIEQQQLNQQKKLNAQKQKEQLEKNALKGVNTKGLESIK